MKMETPNQDYVASSAVGDGLRIVQDIESDPVAIQLDPPPQDPDAPSPDVRRQYRRVIAGLVISDIVSLSVAFVAAYLVRFQVTVHGPYIALGLTAPLLWVLIFRVFSLYSPHRISAVDELQRIVGAASVGILGIIATSFWSQTAFSREWVALLWGFAVFGELITRRGWRWYLARLRVSGRLALRTVVVGTNHEAGRLAHLLQNPGLGFSPLGFVSVAGPTVSPDGLPVIGNIENLRDVVRDYQADCIFVASTAVGSSEMVLAVQAARQEGVAVRVTANLNNILTSRVSVQPLGSLLTLSLRPVRLAGPQAFVKRVFDVVAATILSLLLLPICLVVAVAIAVSSKGPVLFTHKRVTKDGRLFTMYKFRTMVENAEQMKVNTADPFFKLQRDPRLTKVGRVLRRFSIDEIPQLLNVIIGDMSLVGPRPLPAAQVAANPQLMEARHQTRSGITGWWQTNGRSDVAAEEAVRMDAFYIENWSLSLDLYILFKTLGCVLGGKGAY
jgi:exopolysaccharide biosynthesis polyprenyl glycosylphosphotransferase